MPDECALGIRLSTGSLHSPPSVNTSPTQHANHSGSALRRPGSEEFHGAQALFEQLQSLESRFEGDYAASEQSGQDTLPVLNGSSSARRHEELTATAHVVLDNCRLVHESLQDLVANVGKLPSKRQSLRMSGTNTRTTVGLMLNGCAIDNVLPAMAMHADLLKGEYVPTCIPKNTYIHVSLCTCQDVCMCIHVHVGTCALACVRACVHVYVDILSEGNR